MRVCADRVERPAFGVAIRYGKQPLLFSVNGTFVWLIFCLFVHFMLVFLLHCPEFQAAQPLDSIPCPVPLIPISSQASGLRVRATLLSSLAQRPPDLDRGAHSQHQVICAWLLVKYHGFPNCVCTLKSFNPFLHISLSLSPSSTYVCIYVYMHTSVIYVCVFWAYMYICTPVCMHLPVYPSILLVLLL